MKIAILLKSGPYTDEADRALQTSMDMLAQDHKVTLFLLQEAVRFCRPKMKGAGYHDLKELSHPNLEIYALTQDAELRGLDVAAGGQPVLNGTYDSLIENMESCDRVIGIL
ncbi:MAG: DsrE family protein [Thermodesulfobacteriota bacterium]